MEIKSLSYQNNIILACNKYMWDVFLLRRGDIQDNYNIAIDNCMQPPKFSSSIIEYSTIIFGKEIHT
jgi:hypothetical protein